LFIERDQIGDAEIRHKAQHAGHLKSSDQKIETCPVVIRLLRVCHGISSFQKLGEFLNVGRVAWSIPWVDA
jgi:hypothetical protein